jgi:hypothetical protein
MNEPLKNVSQIICRGRIFEVVIDNMNRFWAFEDKYIVDGKLTVEFNGLSGFMSDEFETTCERVIDRIEVDALIAEGFDSLTATINYFFAKEGKW